MTSLTCLDAGHARAPFLKVGDATHALASGGVAVVERLT